MNKFQNYLKKLKYYLKKIKEKDYLLFAPNNKFIFYILLNYEYNYFKLMN